MTPASVGRIGIGVAGQVMGHTGLVTNAPNLGWRDVAFGGLVEKALGVPVRVANDLSVAAWGEKRFGAARGIDDVVLVFVGSGVGSGLILAGRLHEGAQGVAGELGHTKVRLPRPGFTPRRCGCGQLGCLEAYTSGVNVAARVREELAAGAARRILELVDGDLVRVTASVVEDAHALGDAYAVALWEEVSRLLGTAVANLVTLLEPRAAHPRGRRDPGRAAPGGADAAAVPRERLALRHPRPLGRARLARGRRGRHRRRGPRVAGIRSPGAPRRPRLGAPSVEITLGRSPLERIQPGRSDDRAERSRVTKRVTVP